MGLQVTMKKCTAKARASLYAPQQPLVIKKGDTVEVGETTVPGEYPRTFKVRANGRCAHVTRAVADSFLDLTVFDA